MKKRIEVCNRCGRGVAFGSGRFVNRIPDFNDLSTRRANGLKHPDGDFVCFDCDSKTSDNWEQGGVK